MHILIEAIWALAIVGVPIGLFTLAIVWWVLRSGHFGDANSSKELKRKLENMSKAEVDTENDGRDLVHRKWAKFGGGFYGIVAFFTYIVVEVTEIATMIVNFGGFWDFIRQLDFTVIIGIIIEAVTNFITAMVWPLYWMKRVDATQVWVWFGAAYVGYWVGLKLAKRLNQRRSSA